MRRRERHEKHAVDFRCCRKWCLRLMEFTADIRERSGIFEKGARSHSDINLIVVAFGEEEQTILRVRLAFWYSVDGVWDKKEK